MAISVGVLGFAHGHVHAYCTQWRDKPELGIKVVAGWDHDAERLTKAAEGFGLRPSMTIAELLEDVEAVVIASETSRHADLVELAAAAGKAIVLQKPISLTMTEADRIVTAVETAGVPFTLAWQMRVDPQNLEIKKVMEGGTLGKVLMVRRRHGLGVHLWDWFAKSWHNDPKLNRDIWADDSAHAIDFILWLLGAPETVTAEVETLLDPAVANDTGIAIFRYPGGPLAEVVCSFTCPAHENTVEIVFDRGTIIQNYGDVPSCNVPRPNGSIGQKWYESACGAWTISEIASPAGHGERIAGLAAPLAAFLRGERPPIATAQDGRTALRMVLATYVSSRQGRRVRLDDPAIDDV
ncbi:MAG: Gfo/Idh/MocA family oxidoreductase [Fimbriimonas sp.]|nr:Gfo/Idh/MocA family oxidoreductase [Fimbriimonas sp.]